MSAWAAAGAQAAKMKKAAATAAAKAVAAAKKASAVAKEDQRKLRLENDDTGHEALVYRLQMYLVRSGRRQGDIAKEFGISGTQMSIWKKGGGLITAATKADIETKVIALLSDDAPADSSARTANGAACAPLDRAALVAQLRSHATACKLTQKEMATQLALRGGQTQLSMWMTGSANMSPWVKLDIDGRVASFLGVCPASDAPRAPTAETPAVTGVHAIPLPEQLATTERRNDQVAPVDEEVDMAWQPVSKKARHEQEDDADGEGGYSSVSSPPLSSEEEDS